MNDMTSKTRLTHSNPQAASVRLKARSLKRAYGQRRHDFRIGPQPNYVDHDRKELNRILLEPRPLPIIKKDIEQLRRAKGAQRAMKSDAAVVTAGIVTFGHKASELFAELLPEQQDAALFELVSQIAKRLGTRVEAMVIHLDEISLHAHFELRAYNDSGVPVSKVATYKVMSELQDMTAEILAQHCSGIERGHKKFDRIEAGADYAETLNRSVKQLHQDLPAEIAVRQTDLAALEEQNAELSVSMAQTRGYLQKLYDKTELNEKEAKRLKAYEARLVKKQAEQAEIEQSQVDLLSQMKRAHSELEVGREQMAQKKAESLRQVEEANASLAAIEAVSAELEAGTIGRDAQGKLRMSDASKVHAAPEGIARQLVKIAKRFVDHRARLEGNERILDRLTAALGAFLRRDDLTKNARVEAEALQMEVDGGPEC